METEGISKLVDNNTITPAEAFEKFLRLTVSDGAASPRTLVSYRRGLAVYFRWCHALSLDPSLATYDDIQNFRRYLAEKYKRNTVSLRLQAVRILYQALQRWGKRSDNPAAGVKAPKDTTAKSDNVLRRALSPQEIQAFIHFLPDQTTITGARDQAIISLLLWQGLRAAEVADLALADVDRGSYTILTVKGKGGKQRQIILSPPARAALLQWVERRGIAREDGALFYRLDRPGAEHLTVRSIEHAVNRVLHLAGLKQTGRSAHALRHTYAVMASLGKASPEILAESMGHADLATTQIYTRAAARWQENPADAAWSFYQGATNGKEPKEI